MDFHPGKSGGGTSWGATLGAGGRGVMRAAAGGKIHFFFFLSSKKLFCFSIVFFTAS